MDEQGVRLIAVFLSPDGKLLATFGNLHRQIESMILKTLW